MTTLYGVSGKAEAGKDTLSKAVAKASKDTETPFTITHFADTLKSQAIRIFGISEYDAYDPEGKKRAFASPIEMDSFLGVMREVTGLDIQPQRKIAKTPRKLLQYYGTEYVRSVQDDYWIRKTVDDAVGNVLVSDTRFLNEAEAIRKAGGKIVKVVRIDAPKSTDQHTSEAEIDLIVPDLLLPTRTGDFTRTELVATCLAEGKWDQAISIAADFMSKDRQDGYDLDLL